MRDMDRLAGEIYNIPGIILMENAASSVVAEILKKADKQNFTVNIFAGRGNNGGDGFAAARQLFLKNIDVRVFVSDTQNIKGDALINFNIVKALGIPLKTINSSQETINMIKEAQVNVDAIFGTGISKEITGELKDVIHLINQYSQYTISIDIPSGVNADNGKIEAIAVKADKTVTFAYLKQGMLLNPAIDYTGEIVLADIGMPVQLIKQIDVKTKVIDSFEFPKRLSRTHKGTYGRLAAFAGSQNMNGAAFLLCRAAYRIGAGLVELCSEEDVLREVRGNIPEVIGTVLKEIQGGLFDLEGIKDRLKNAQAAAAGCGIGVSPKTEDFIEKLLYYCEVPLVLDADALNILSSNPNILSKAKAHVIVTPHPKEMSRLTGLTVKEILENTVETAKEFSAKYNVITLLKDNRSIIANPKGEIYINLTGSPAMSKAGAGDVLTGIIGGLLAQGAEPFKAAAAGAYIHGKAGEKAQREYGEYGVMASDIIKCI